MENLFEDPFYLFLDIMLFIFGLSSLFLIHAVYTSGEKEVVAVISEKNGTHQTYKEMSEEVIVTLSGAQVAQEIMELDEDVFVRINSTLLNEIRTPTGENFLTYVKKYNPEALYEEISPINTYKKEIIVSSTGKIVGVNYIMVV